MRIPDTTEEANRLKRLAAEIGDAELAARMNAVAGEARAAGFTATAGAMEAYVENLLGVAECSR